MNKNTRSKFVNLSALVVGLVLMLQVIPLAYGQSLLFPPLQLKQTPGESVNQTAIGIKKHGFQKEQVALAPLGPAPDPQPPTVPPPPPVGSFGGPGQMSFQQRVVQYDQYKNCASDQHTPTNYLTYLTHFACGHVTVFKNGTTLRKFSLFASDYGGSGKAIAISKDQKDPVVTHAWMFNGTVPGPTIRVTVGDHVQITVYNSKGSALIHSFHMHSIHPGPMDGVMGEAGMIFPGQSFTFDFIASPAGNYPYHCHVAPIEEHISRGLYGQLIIDPKNPRTIASEMVMLLNEYTFSFQGVNGSGHYDPARYTPATQADIRKNLTDVISNSDEGNGPDNQFYSVNGMPFGYLNHTSIHLTTHTSYRIYLLNMVEFDPVNSFHMHGTMFYYTQSGTLNSSIVYTDVVLQQQADRGMIEFQYDYPGEFMFHSHIAHFSDLGWVAFYNVTAPNGRGEKVN